VSSITGGLLVDNINNSIEPIDVAVEPVRKWMSSYATSMIAAAALVAYTGIRRFLSFRGSKEKHDTLNDGDPACSPSICWIKTFFFFGVLV
jgi:hypothetical protein